MQGYQAQDWGILTGIDPLARCWPKVRTAVSAGITYLWRLGPSGPYPRAALARAGVLGFSGIFIAAVRVTLEWWAPPYRHNNDETP